MRSFQIDVLKYDESFLSKTIQKRISETHCSSEEEYSILLEQNDKEGKFLLESLQINYSEFFREGLAFALLERIIFPALIQNKKNDKHREIRIWSSACAAGQEAYSIAILLEELLKGNEEKFTYRIFATDQSESKLDEARKGQYSSSDLNKITLQRLDRWFTKKGESYIIKPELKNHIDFSQFDLLNEQLSAPPASIFGGFDLVVGANLLFYYKNVYREIILRKISNCLTNEGYLMTGEAEREILMNFNYHEIFPKSAIFQNLVKHNRYN
ncbi:MAG: CheR family methyltransferase [Ignavibacteriaceae bacterium]|jgi:chemotaxis methyl-accepting protein methylase